MPLPRNLLDELKRRRVFRVAAAYAVVAWLVIEVASTVLPALGAPPWAVSLVVASVLIGFPLAVALAWAFDIGPDGLVRTAHPPLGGAPEAAATAPAAHATRTGAVTRARAPALAAIGVATAGVLGATFLLWAPAPRTATAGDDPTPAEAAPSIAVLPFADLSAAADQEYFGQGLAEELLNTLAQMDGLRVAARTSSFAFAGKDVGVTEIGRQLGVGAVLEGSIRTSANGIRITAQLIDARTGYHLWSQVYERAPADLFDVQDEISTAIANALELRLVGRGGAAPRRARPADPEALRLYFQGRHAWNRRTVESLRASVGFFEKALEHDPGFALAYAGLADAYMILEDHRALAREEAFPLGTAAARRALELDETLAEAHTSLAHILMHQMEDEASEREFRRALELNPNSASAHQWYSLLLARMGRWDEAHAHAGRAAELDPLYMPALRGVGLIYYLQRRYEEALTHFDAALQRFPDDGSILHWVAWAHLKAGRPEPALEIWSRLDHRASVPIAHAAAGRHDEARRLLAELENDPDARPAANAVAVAYSYLGETDRAFEWLQRAADANEPILDFMPIEPGLDLLRDDPRFRAIMRQLGQLR